MKGNSHSRRFLSTSAMALLGPPHSRGPRSSRCVASRPQGCPPPWSPRGAELTTAAGGWLPTKGTLRKKTHENLGGAGAAGGLWAKVRLCREAFAQGKTTRTGVAARGAGLLGEGRLGSSCPSLPFRVVSRGSHGLRVVPRKQVTVVMAFVSSLSFPLSHLLSYRFMSEVRLANIKAPLCVTSSDTGEKCQYKYQISSYHCFTPGEGAVVGRFWKK